MHQTERVGTLQYPEKVQEIIDQDLVPCLLFNSIARMFLGLLSSHEYCNPHIRNSAARVIREIDDMDSKVVHYSPKTRITVSNQAMVDSATIIQQLCKFSGCEDDQEYIELFNIITTCIDNVLDARNKRSKVYFPKYKALIKLITDEVKRDTNREPSQILFRKTPLAPGGELFLRTAAPEPVHQIH